MKHSIPVTVVSCDAIFDGNKLLVEMTDGSFATFAFNVAPGECKDKFLKTFEHEREYRYLTKDQIAQQVRIFNTVRRDLANDIYRSCGYH